jgi:hypothetical protein
MVDLVESGDGRVHLALAGHMPYPTTATLSSEAATEIGNAYDLISANPNTFQGLDAEVEAGGPQMLLYTKAAAVRNAGLPEAMYAHRVGGSMSRADRKYDSTWHVFTTQAGSDAWRKYHLDQLRGGPSWAQGYFCDAVVMSYSQGGAKPGKPPSFASQYTLDEWLALISGDLDYWEQQTGTPPLAINGLRAQTLASLSPRVAMVENAWRSQGGVLPDADQWVKTMDTFAQAQTQQWVPWAFVKLFDMSASLWDRWRRMAAPSALIADAGSFLLGFGGSEGSPPAWVTNEHRQVCWTPNIGKPTSAPWPIDASADGTYRRAFEQGLVVYNPGTNGVSVSRASGAQTFPVGPQEGIILRHTTQGWVLVA